MELRTDLIADLARNFPKATFVIAIRWLEGHRRRSR
jgi:hypothetical protein